MLTQIHTAIQQSGFKRVKRGFRPLNNINQAPVNGPTPATFGQAPTDPLFPMQWYLRNTGQNGGKVRLDLNVQAAWDQGITGKNITTAIMDDGKFICFLNKTNKKINTFFFQELIICIQILSTTM